MESAYTMNEADFPSDQNELKQVIKVLQEIIEKLKAELESTYHKLGKAEKKVKKLRGQNDDLHEYNKKLGLQLAKEKKLPKMRDAAAQTDHTFFVDEILHPFHLGNDGELPGPANNTDAASVWPEADAEQGVSIADSLKAAAEEALQETGVVYDDSSGMYYDYNTGYYFDPDRSLYYEPHSGTYYYYNSSTGKYEFHSQVDVNQYAQQSSSKKSRSRTTDLDSDQSDKPRRKKTKKAEKPKSRKRSSVEEEDKGKTTKSRKKKVKEKVVKDSDTKEKRVKDSDAKEKRVKDSDAKSAGDENSKKTSCGNTDQSDENLGDLNEGKEVEKNTEEIGNEENEKEEEQMEEGEVASQPDSEMEEGELSDSSACEEENNHSEQEIEAENTTEETSALYYPPCIRAMVTASDCLDVGTLFLVTLMGTTIGRDENLGHGILIPDEQISKMHAEVTYNEEHRRYTIKDHASQNGTFVNDYRISESKVMSETWSLTNMDVVRVGGTTLKLHIHPGQETCDDCEPGIVQAKVQAEQPKETMVSSKEDKEKLRRKALNQIKKKYGLKEASYVDEGGSCVKEGYEDKAAIRRKTKGSDNPYQKDDMPASVNRAIPSENKGRQLLAKMGWKEGQGLGRAEQGRAEPVQAFLRGKQSAGLGSMGSLQHSLDAQPQQVQQTQRWMKAQERFMALTGVQDDEDEGDDATAAAPAVVIPIATPKAKTITFIQGESLIQDKDTTKVNDGKGEG